MTIVPPPYFDTGARAAWAEITGDRALRGTGDRLRAEQAALLLAELRAAPESFGASKHAQLRALLGELLPPAAEPDRGASDEAGLGRALNRMAANLAREEQEKREARRAQREARKAKGG